MVVKNAFGRLKGRWRILLKRNDTIIQKLPNLVIACCVLHNLCESSGEDFDTHLINEVDQTADACETGNDNDDACLVRNAFVEYFER